MAFVSPLHRPAPRSVRTFNLAGGSPLPDLPTKGELCAEPLPPRPGPQAQAGTTRLPSQQKPPRATATPFCEEPYPPPEEEAHGSHSAAVPLPAPPQPPAAAPTGNARREDASGPPPRQDPLGPAPYLGHTDAHHEHPALHDDGGGGTRPRPPLPSCFPPAETPHAGSGARQLSEGAERFAPPTPSFLKAQRPPLGRPAPPPRPGPSLPVAGGTPGASGAMMRLGRAGRELLRWGRGGPPTAAPRRGAEVLVGAAGGESSGECGGPRLQPGYAGDRGVGGADRVSEPVFWRSREGARRSTWFYGFLVKTPQLPAPPWPPALAALAVPRPGPETLEPSLQRCPDIWYRGCRGHRAFHCSDALLYGPKGERVPRRVRRGQGAYRSYALTLF